MRRDVDLLDAEIRSCVRCREILAKWPEDPPKVLASVRPRPVLSEPIRASIMLVGQAPGPTEYRTGRPFSGEAGNKIRQLMERCGLKRAEFDSNVYQTSIVKCFPGRKLNRDRGEDRVPCAAMTANCRPFLLRQIELVRPYLIVSLGGFAAKQLQRMRAIKTRPLAELVGTVEEWKGSGIRIAYLPHTSGSSRFLNDPENRSKFERAQAQLADELRMACSLAARAPA